MPCSAVQNPYPEAQQTLFQFSSPADLALWNVFSDAEYGGKSTAELRLSDATPVGVCWALSSPSCNRRLWCCVGRSLVSDFKLDLAWYCVS